MMNTHRILAILAASLLAIVPCHGKDALILDLQKKLAAAGFDPKGIDGEWGKGTESALKAWQTANSLTPTGRLETDSETVVKLGLALPASDKPQDITRLLSENRVEAKTSGNDIRSVSVSIRSKVPYPLSVSFPVGTFFVCGGGSAQNMVATESEVLTLNDESFQEVSISAACANRERAIPNEKNRFTIRASPSQKELAALMPVLDHAGVEFSVRQAAVWIVTDNADYDDLGVLVSRPAYAGFGGTRVIDAEDTARAMQLVQKAGIKLAGKQIWSDRRSIAKEVDDIELKKFLTSGK